MSALSEKESGGALLSRIKMSAHPLPWHVCFLTSGQGAMDFLLTSLPPSRRKWTQRILRKELTAVYIIPVLAVCFRTKNLLFRYIWGHLSKCPSYQVISPRFLWLSAPGLPFKGATPHNIHMQWKCSWQLLFLQLQWCLIFSIWLFTL